MFVGYAIGGTIAFALYALIWLFIWWLLASDDGRIHQFHLKLVVASIPLILFTAFYIWAHPMPENATMIPLSSADIHFDFSTAVTGTILFPLYSIALYRWVLPRGRKWLPYLAVASSHVVIGAIAFMSCYVLLPTNW